MIKYVIPVHPEVLCSNSSEQNQFRQLHLLLDQMHMTLLLNTMELANGTANGIEPLVHERTHVFFLCVYAVAVCSSIERKIVPRSNCSQQGL